MTEAEELEMYRTGKMYSGSVGVQLGMARAQSQLFKAALERVASSEAFGNPRAIDPERDEELILRMNYAKEILKGADKVDAALNAG